MISDIISRMHKCTFTNMLEMFHWKWGAKSYERNIERKNCGNRNLEGHPADEQLSGYITFGLFVKVGEETIIIEDITDDLAALKSFAKKLKAADFDLTSLKYLIDDFLSDRYGL